MSCVWCTPPVKVTRKNDIHFVWQSLLSTDMLAQPKHDKQKTQFTSPLRRLIGAQPKFVSDIQQMIRDMIPVSAKNLSHAHKTTVIMDAMLGKNTLRIPPPKKLTPA